MKIFSREQEDGMIQSAMYGWKERKLLNIIAKHMEKHSKFDFHEITVDDFILHMPMIPTFKLVEYLDRWDELRKHLEHYIINAPNWQKKLQKIIDKKDPIEEWPPKGQAIQGIKHLFIDLKKTHPVYLKEIYDNLDQVKLEIEKLILEKV